MEKYITPIKQNNHPYTFVNNKNNSQRSGDWVCSKCQNLNFSFRKKCNRCKNQTPFNYEYYFYIQPNTKDYQFRTPLSENYDHKNNIKQAQFSEKSTLINQKQNTSPINNCQSVLPSISPLLKKYKQSKCKDYEYRNEKNKCIFDDIWDQSTNSQSQSHSFNSSSLNFNSQQNYYQFNQAENQELQRIIQKIIL